MTCPPGTTWGAAALSACCCAVLRAGSSQTPLMGGEPRASGPLENAGVHLAWPWPLLKACPAMSGHPMAALSWDWLRACAACLQDGGQALCRPWSACGQLSQKRPAQARERSQSLQGDDLGWLRKKAQFLHSHNMACNNLPASLLLQGRSM